MIYTNLFKSNKSQASKTKIYYMVESRKYKFNIIFDKKFTTVIYSLFIGAGVLVALNLGVYHVINSVNEAKLKELETENSNYISSLNQLEGQKNQYLAQKVNVDNIYTISSKPTKWSSIIENIAEQLPYDSVLTSVSTMSLDAVASTIGENAIDSSQTETLKGPTDEAGNPIEMSDEELEAEMENLSPTESLDTQLKTNEGIVINDVVAITGKSLSMVNLSLFLDKLDGLEIFNKVECYKASIDEDNIYYEFIIYAYLN